MNSGIKINMIEMSGDTVEYRNRDELMYKWMGRYRQTDRRLDR